MASTRFLFDHLTGSPDSTGSWTLVSGPGSDADLKVNGTPQTITYGNSVGTNYFVNIGFDSTIGTATGVYVFRYTTGVSPCEDTADVTITVSAPPTFDVSEDICLCHSGTDVTEDICNCQVVDVGTNTADTICFT